MHGWLIIDKPVGPGSTQIVSAVKRALRDGGYPKVKVGHGGTLDPLASGVLPVALGEATKLCGRMLDSDKAYDFTIRFGAETEANVRLFQSGHGLTIDGKAGPKTMKAIAEVLAAKGGDEAPERPKAAERRLHPLLAALLAIINALLNRK